MMFSLYWSFLKEYHVCMPNVWLPYNVSDLVLLLQDDHTGEVYGDPGGDLQFMFEQPGEARNV